MSDNWFNARETVEAASALADSFPHEATHGEAFRQFIQTAVRELHSRKLSFYKRVRFAAAFKWRLRANGVKAETAHEITQTLLIQALMPSAAVPAVAPVDSLPERTNPSNTTKIANRRQTEALFREALDCFSRGEYLDAVARYERLLAVQPRNADFLNNLGAALARLGRTEAAETEFRKAISINPKHADAHVNRGKVMVTRGRLQDAENCLRRAVKANPTDPVARGNFGMTLVLLGRTNEARIEFDKVLKVTPRHAIGLYGMGMLARSEGRFEEAEDLFRRALVSDPQMAPAWSALVGVRKMTSEDVVWLKRAEQTAAGLKTAAEEAEVRFAIGKYFDDLDKHEQAFASYQRANDLLKSVAPVYDRNAHRRFVDDIMSLYTPEAIARASAGHAKSTERSSDKPVFVVGMPRSGTSLTEQILASHPAAAGAGELPFWFETVRRDDERTRRELLGSAVSQKIAADYLRMLTRQFPQARYVVDKAPGNCDFLGIIHSVLPNARFIYMRRDPLDTCLSCYFQHFSLALNYTFDLSDLAYYYTEHARLMAHWRTVLPPGSVLDVPYEGLVADQETWTRRILEFVGLDWDPRCLQFSKTKRTVVTSSYWQVRQPLYAGSVQRWRNYSKHLGPLRGLKSA